MLTELPPINIKENFYKVPNPEDVFERFSNSEFGEYLSGKARFHLFKHEKVSDRLWIENAGPDTDNLLHMKEMYNLAKKFLAESGGFSKKEEELITFTAIVHDMAEAVIGDIPRNLKTEDDEREEMVVLTGMLDYFLSDMNEYERYNLIGDVLDVMTEKDSKLGKAFSAIENVGYNTTAINCWMGYRMLDDTGESSEMKESFRSLSHLVVIGDMPRLVEQAREYRYVKLFLLRNENYILDILNDAQATGIYDRGLMTAAKNSYDDFNSDLVA